MKMEDEARKSQTAIRCAKAAILLSSLSNRNMKATIDNEDEEKEMMKMEIGGLQLVLVRERMKSKKIKLCGLMEVVLEVMVVLLFSSFVLMVGFKFN
ncbi:hypothetical protein ACOSQ2_010433 [Xanthoceras sorbifolium]